MNAGRFQGKFINPLNQRFQNASRGQNQTAPSPNPQDLSIAKERQHAFTNMNAYSEMEMIPEEMEECEDLNN